MAEVSYYVALPFVRNDEGELVAGEAQECQTPSSAIRRAQGMAAVNAGAIAFSRAGDPKTGEFEPAEVLKLFSEAGRRFRRFLRKWPAKKINWHAHKSASTPNRVPHSPIPKNGLSTRLRP